MTKKLVWVKHGLGIHGLKKVLETYISLNQRYVRQMDYDDCAFVYTEMANVGMFASAASMNGWSAICESQHEKNKENKDGKVVSKMGRSDLYLIDGHREYLCEAKFMSLNYFSSKKTLKNRFAKVMTSAIQNTEEACRVVKSSGKVSTKNSFEGLAIVFAYDEILPAKVGLYGNKKSDIIEFIESSKAEDGLDQDAYASYRLQSPISGWDDGKEVTGITVFVKHVTV